MAVTRGIYRKVYPVEFTDEQKKVLQEILDDMMACRNGGQIIIPPPQICLTCGHQERFAMRDTWMGGDWAELRGKVHVMKALLGLENLVIDHT